MPSAGRERQVARAGAGGDDDVLGREGLGALLALHLERVGALEGSRAHVHGDLVLLHQVRDALVELFGDATAALHHRLKIGLYLFGNQAVILGVLHVVKDLGRAQQRLGRDAAPVEADPAEQLALDDRRLEPELRGADRRDIAAGARSEDDDVVRNSWSVFLSSNPRNMTWRGAGTSNHQISPPCRQARRRLASGLAPSRLRNLQGRSAFTKNRSFRHCRALVSGGPMQTII